MTDHTDTPESPEDAPERVPCDQCGIEDELDSMYDVGPYNYCEECYRVEDGDQ